jgi:hypothetical protein
MVHSIGRPRFVRRALGLALGLQPALVACGSGELAAEGAGGAVPMDAAPAGGRVEPDTANPPGGPDASGRPDGGAPRGDAVADASPPVRQDAGPDPADSGTDTDTLGPADLDARPGAVDAVSDAASVPVPDAGDIGPCNREGGRVCGGNGVGGDPQTLYTCRDARRVAVERCETTCDWMPPGVPDRCMRPIDDIPADLVDALDAVPYVEGDCVDVEFPGWPHPAERCDYSAGPLSARVVVANPSPRRVARWIIDSAGVIPTIDRRRATDRATWVASLVIIAGKVMGQSSRIFPLEGGVIENMGDGWIEYPFRQGVTDGCSTGCYCRINSLHRTEYCAYEAAMGRETEADCFARIGERGLTAAWGEVCQGNHDRAWESDVNEHFRARLWAVRAAVIDRCPGDCDAPVLLAALREELP